MKLFAVAAALLLAGCGAEEAAPEIAVQGAWARPAVEGQSTSAAYFTVVNTGGADRLVSVSSSAAGAALHSMTMDGGIMRMRPLEALDIPANSSVELKPGGTHVMLIDVKSPLAAGDAVPLRLRFERAGTREVTAEVREGAGR